MGEGRGRVSEFRPRRFRRYPDYRDSGVEWLGEIPAHWEIRRADRRLTSLKHPVVPSEIRGQDVFHYSIPNVQQFGSGVIEPTATIDSSKTAIDRPVLLVSKLNPRKGTLALAKPHPALMTLASSEFIVMEPKGCVLEFARYFYRSEHVRLALSARVESATRSHQRCSPDDISKLPVSWPSKPEQTTIATFLDRETAKIDALVEKKERLIELLQEKRTALITRAVTRGLDPSVPMKDSGIEWLGEIPAHWNVTRIKNLSPFVTSGSRGWAEFYSDEGPLFLRIGNVQSESVDLDLDEIQHVDPPRGAEGERTRVRPGDILVSITALIGAVAVVPRDLPEAFVNQHLALVRLTNSDVNSRWIAYCIKSPVGQEQFTADLYGGTKDGLGLNDVRSLIVLEPPIWEQERMVRYLDQQNKELTTLVQVVRIAIDHLKEYRTALISAAVTGKIDVRDEAA